MQICYGWCCFHACDMSCALFMPTICTHDMLAMIPSSTLHLCTTSLLDLITMIDCFVAPTMFHYYTLSWVDDIYVHASHMIYLDHCLLCPLVASLISTCSECNHTRLIDLRDLDILLVMHASLIQPILFGCSCIICFHTIPHLVLSYDKNDESTCWVSYHSNDRCYICTNLICFSECLSCSFILRNSQGISITGHIGHVKAYTMCNTNIFENLLKMNSFPLSHSQIRMLDGSLFHCYFLLVFYMIHLVNGGPTLEMEPMDLQVEEYSDLVDAPPDQHFYHDIELWYNTNHNKFAWIDPHYDCLVASCISMSSMIYELAPFLSKFVLIFLDGIFIHNDHIAYHQLHDNIIILSIHCHIHAIDKPSHYDIILHRGCIDHIHTTFMCTMNAFTPMNALHLIPYHLAKLHVLCPEQSCLADSF